MWRSRLFFLSIVLLVGCFTVPVSAQSSDPPVPGIVHIIQQGETMFSIARRYGVTVDAVTHRNNIGDPRQIYAGQRLIIPATDADATAQSVIPYMVRAGDTLDLVARRYATTSQDLMRVNRMLSPNVLYVGQVIQVPQVSGSSSDDVLSGALHVSGTVLVVQSDEILLATALRHGVSVWSLATTNHMANPALIYPGQELLIPSGESGMLPAPLAEIGVFPLPTRQGEAMLIGVRTTGPVILSGTLFDQDVPFFSGADQNSYYAAVGIHVFTEPGIYDLDLLVSDSQGHAIQTTIGILVEAGQFSYERIDLPANRTNLLDPATISLEKERLGEVINLTTAERSWETNFLQPCVGTISSYFGSHRSYSGGPYTSYHSGVDFRAPTGTEVMAAASGTVVLAEYLPIHGNIVIVDHGWGVLTGYAHLSVMHVVGGQWVSRGEALGRVGNTGQSTGSHLHWEVWVSGTSVNGLQWFDIASPDTVFE